MKHIATLLILFAFVGMAVFGFAVISHQMAHGGNEDCIAGVVTNSDCPTDDLVGAHHIAAFQFFSSATPVGPFLMFGLAMLALTFFLVAPYLLYERRVALVYARFKQRFRSNYHLSTHGFLRWISRFQLSPAF